MFIEIIFIILIGIIISYNDIKNNIIPNKWIILAISIGIITNLSYFIIGKFSNTYWIEYLLNLLFSLISGILIWLGGFWSAGDAKLFLAFNSLIPLQFYHIGYIPSFPGFIILINTFFPLLIIFLTIILIKIKFKDIKKVFIKTLNPKTIFTHLFFLVSMVWIIRLMTSFVGTFYPGIANVFTTVILIFLLLFIGEDIFGLALWKLSLIFIILGIFLGGILTKEYLMFSLFVFIIFIFIRLIIIELGYKVFSTNVYIENLKPGMIPLENISKEGNNYLKEKILPISFLSGVQSAKKKKIFQSVSDGITEREILHIIKLHKSGKMKSHSLKVSQTLPFAPFLFFGVLLTLFIKGSILIILIRFIETFL